MHLERYRGTGCVPVKLILDTTALLSGKEFPGELYTSARILREARGKGLDARGEAMVSAKVTVVEPDAQALLEIGEAALRTGDAPRLSDPDVQVLALALDLGGVLVTDDYSLQNVARELGVEYMPAGLEGIREAVRWFYRCSGCGRYWQDPLKVCPVCGSKVRTTRRSPGRR
jgi:UPF0271 protein